MAFQRLVLNQRRLLTTTGIASFTFAATPFTFAIAFKTPNPTSRTSTHTRRLINLRLIRQALLRPLSHQALLPILKDLLLNP